MIVLKENEWAENMIKEKILGKKPSETLRRVARYYIDKGYGKSDIRKLLDTYVIQCNPASSLIKWSETLDYAMSRALKYNAVDIDYIDITKPEIEKIQALDGKQIKRLAFALLCLAKYWHTLSPESDYWVNSKDNEIMAMANINTSIKRQSMMYGILREAGMVQFSKKVDNTNVRVCFVESGESEIHITDFRNLGYQFLKYCGEPYFECENCGMTVKINSPSKGRRQKYCKDCAVKIQTQQKVNSVMKMRSNSRVDTNITHGL